MTLPNNSEERLTILWGPEQVVPWGERVRRRYLPLSEERRLREVRGE